MNSEHGFIYTPVRLPSSEYSWELDSDSKYLGTIEPDGLFSSKLTAGVAEIRVIDKKFPNNTAEASVNIVEPFQVKLDLADVSEGYSTIKLENKKDKVSSFTRQLKV